MSVPVNWKAGGWSFLKISLLWLVLVSFWAAEAGVITSSNNTLSANNTLPGCPEKCGNVTIPYPFGIVPECHLPNQPNFHIKCDTSFNPPRPFIGDSKLEVVEISSFPNHTLRVKTFVATSTVNKTAKAAMRLPRPYTFSATANKFTTVGCVTAAVIRGSGINDGSCVPICTEIQSMQNETCNGLGCCQTPIPKGSRQFGIVVWYLPGFDYGTLGDIFSSNGYAFLAEQDRYRFETSDLLPDDGRIRDKIINTPVVLNWAIVNPNQSCEDARNQSDTYACKEHSDCYDIDDTNHVPGYRCRCRQGFQGNPYVGCQDIDECLDPSTHCDYGHCNNIPGNYTCTCPLGYSDGKGCVNNVEFIILVPVAIGIGIILCFLSIVISGLYFIVRKIKFIKLKQKYFEENGGSLFQQKIASCDGAAKIFTIRELKRATNNFCENRVLGRGGNGTVYKGHLTPDKLVAIKKSKIVEKTQIHQFINEIVILAQINHRNVVKLLGCCLETEVPLLVYEFISNGTLYSRIHRNDDEDADSFPWEARLRIASETAASLSYLHSAASIPIIHRDVKSANILLDHNLVAKVADFGASRLNPQDESGIDTLVQGTIGYLDPEYCQTSKLTEKSDVYSFGIVLAELLTGKMSIWKEGSEPKALSSYFLMSMQQNRLFEILDVGVVSEANRVQLVGVAEVARRCLKQCGKDRPTMTQVAAELEGLRKFEKHPLIQEVHCDKATASLFDESSDLYPTAETSSSTAHDCYYTASSWNHAGESSGEYYK